MEYKEEDFLQLSGLQHFKFCRRRWALIHIEHQWAENYRTIDGEILHQNAHDTQFQESRGDRFITRGVSVCSAQLGASGQCDVLEYSFWPLWTRKRIACVSTIWAINTKRRLSISAARTPICRRIL